MQFDRCVAEEPRLKYQRAFEFLIGRRGQDVANRIIQRAVCKARTNDDFPADSARRLNGESLDQGCERLELDIEGWHLPPAIAAVGKILADYQDIFGKTLLTSNFDPLIEVSIQKQHGQVFRTVLHSDGNLRQTMGQGSHIIHLHGYWLGYDTLHTPRQLIQHRPQLQQSLSKLLRETTVVVIAYGGWDDIFTTTLMDLVADDTSYPEVIWTFRESDEGILSERFTDLLKKLNPGLDRGRVTLFKSIDCHSFFPKLHQALGELSPLKKSEEPEVKAELVEGTNHPTTGTELRIVISVPVTPARGIEPDNPPQVSNWVGRDAELAILRSTPVPVVSICGIGGQGKSTLASIYLSELTREAGDFQFWDWRDCKEEGDRVHTQLLCIIERLSSNSVRPEHIQEYDIRAVVDLFFQTLSQRKAIFVFDNIDHYIDLETFQPVGGMGYLFEAALTKRHCSRFIFTCRPSIRQESINARIIELQGLSYEETRELALKRSEKSLSEEVIRDLHRLTDGHPLWVNVISTQASRRAGGLRDVLDDIRAGKGDLPQKTLRSIWETLSDHQKNVLKTLAELEQAVSEDRLAEMLPGFTFNRLNRASKTLKAMNLIETKGAAGGLLLELHPIIRQFVRTEFPRSERERVLARILNVFDKLIGRYRNLLPKQPSRAILEPWIQKAELQINFGRFDEAVQTIQEAASPLLSRGFPEELIRLGRKLLLAIDWPEACTSFKNFDSVFKVIINTFIQFGEYEEARKFLKQYEQGIPGKSAQYINYCDLCCYESWYQGEFEKAIYWGEQGESLKELGKVDTRFSTNHNLALARRDSGKIEKALVHFLGGKSIEEVTAPGEVDKDKQAPFYGNIGRCLFLGGDVERALVCYRKSAEILEADSGYDSKLNKGYARYWIGEALEHQGRDIDLAYCAYRAALEQWANISPPRAKLAGEGCKRLTGRSAQLAESVEADPWKAEKKFQAWLVG